MVEIYGSTIDNIVKAIRVDDAGRLVIRGVLSVDAIRKFVTLSTTTETAVWTPATGKKFVVTDLIISGTTTATVALRDGTAGSTILIVRLAAGYPLMKDFDTDIFSGAINRILTAQTSAATTYVYAGGYEI